MQEACRFGIEVNFLTGRYVATSHADRRQPEWPPHPARLFSALVATWADADDPRQDERDVLEWLEAQGPPGIATETEVTPRTVVSHFVPVNDIAIVGLKSQKRWAEQVAQAKTVLHDALVASGGEATVQVQRAQNELARLRDVGSQVSNPGKTTIDTAQWLFPESRKKQERRFPSVTIGAPMASESLPTSSPRVTFVWDRNLPDDAHDVLDRLLIRLTRLGHSSSLVSCRVVRATPAVNLSPSRTGATRLRHIRPGQLADLERRFTQHQGISPRALPYTDVRYGQVDNKQEVGEDAPNTVGDWIVFEFLPDSRAYPVYRSVEVAKTLRSAIFSYADDPIPEGLSGHTPNGAPISAPHVAFVPLPFAGYAHGDGRLLGIAVSVPENVDEASRRALYLAIGKWEGVARDGVLRLFKGKQAELRMRRLRGPVSLASLRRSAWSRPARRWVSVTPIALPRHPGRLRGGTASARARAWKSADAAVRAAVAHVGLPDPSEVEVSLTPLLVGSRAVSAYPPFSQRGRNGVSVRRQLVHAVVTFDRLVQGPLMLGSGRFVGLGLMRPLRVREETPSSQESDRG